MTRMPGSAATEALADLPLGEVLERLAARTPAPGGGSSAAIAGCLAAALVEMASGFEESPDAGGRGTRAAELRGLLVDLADRDLTSYEPVLQALRRPADDSDRAAAVAAALSVAAATPLGIARVSAELAGLAQAATEAAGRHLVGDSATAAVLAEAACAAAVLLVEINLGGTADPRLQEAAQLTHAAMQARECACAKANER
jgi:formiminotetrahydrofolate cyclodeaminase